MGTILSGPLLGMPWPSLALGWQSELNSHVIRLSTSENNELQTETHWHANTVVTFKDGLT